MSLWRRIVWRAVTVSGAAAVGVAAGLVQAQVAAPAQRADIVRRGGAAVNPENYDAKESNEGVYAPESSDAMDQMAHAQSMERQKEWNKSADYYQELLTSPKYAAKVVPSRQDEDHRISQYTSVEELVTQRLSRWPREGLDVYRARYEAPAQSLLESSKGDVSVLQQVFARYFVTDAGKSAGLQLMDHYLEAGEFRAAADIGERLLKWHPNVLAERAALLYRMAVAYHSAGDDIDAAARLEQLKKSDPQSKGTVRGKDVLLADSLAAELAQPVPTASGSTADSYTTFGGDLMRNRNLAVNGTPGAHLYSIRLSKPARLTGPQGPMLDAKYKDDVKNGATLGIMPVVDRGELFFQDGERLYGVNLESGVPIPGWQQSHGPEHDGAYTLPNVTGSPRSHQLTLTVTDQSVLAVMGQQDPNLVRVGLPEQGETRLVCLDRATGKENWLLAPSQFKQTALKTLQFSGSPLVVGSSVLVVGNASKQAGFEDCYVLCFDLPSGMLRWSTNVASASTVAAAWAGFNPNFALPQNESHLAYSNGRVYVQTNRGAVAALDAYNGTIAWLDIYPRGQQAMMNPAFNPMMFQGGGQFQQTQTRPWAFNPVIVSGGLVFTLPLEGKHLLIYDAATGQEVKRIDLADLSQRVKSADEVNSDQFDTLIGVSGERLALAGTKTIVLLNWKAYDGEHYKDDMIFWIEGTSGAAIRGRPLLTANSIYVPAEDRLYRVDLKSGVIKDVHPDWPRSWEEDEGPGNVLVTSDHTVIAGADTVDVYTDLAMAKKKLDRQVADAPADPQPRLRYAEVMYAAGDYPTALAKLDEAIQRLGGPEAMQPGGGRDRVFNDALTFARRLKADDRKEARDRVEKFFDRAHQAALTPGQKVQYAMARAKFDELKGEPPAAVALYQEILSDPATRAIPLPDESSGSPMPASADVVARKQIAELMKRDPQIYDAFEKRAASALEEAQNSGSPAKLLEVAQEYPNSAVAGKATLAAADTYEAAGDVHAARHVLNDIYFDRNDKAPEWQQILEAMARTDPRSAAHMLAQGVEQLHDPKLIKPLKLADATEVPAGTPFSEALDKVRKLSYQRQAASLPNLHLPVPQDYKTYPKPFLPNGPVINNVDVLVTPLREFARPDRIVVGMGGPSVAVFAAGSEKPVVTIQFPEDPRGCAWLDKDLLVWGTTKLALLKGDGAELAWTTDLGGLAPIDVIAGDQSVQTPDAGNNQLILNNRLRNRVFINQGARVVVRNGVVMPLGVAPVPAKPVPGGPEQIDQMLPVGERVLVSTSGGRVAALDAKSGAVVWQTRLSDRPVDRLLADEDFTLIKAGDDASVRLAVLDTYTGHVRGSRTYPRESNSFPQNLALSPDGTLVYTLPDRICLKDLYKPWDQKGIEKVTPPGQASFNGLTEPDQLVISQGRILALSDSGNGDRPGEKFVRLYSLDTGEPMILHFQDGQQVEKALSIGSKSPDVVLRVVGPRVYMIAPDAAISYNLDTPDDKYPMFDQESDGMTAQMSFIGQDYLILLNGGGASAPNAPAAGAAQPAPAATVSPSYTIYAFSRASKNGKESGRLDYSTPVTDPAGITTSWQAFDGGLAYLSADHKLHLLMGGK